VWDFRSGKCILKYNGHKNWVSTVRFSRDGHLICSASHDNTVKVFDWAAGKCLQTVQLKSSVTGLDSTTNCATGDNAFLAATKDLKLRLYSMGGQLLRSVSRHRGSVAVVAAAKDSSIVGSAGSEGLVYIWKLHP